MTVAVRLPPLAPAAAIAAAVVLGASAGDAFVAVVLLCIGLGTLAGAAALGAVAAMVARWGTPDLGAVAGDQAVLGPAVTVGPAAAAASSALAALALLLVARPVAVLGAGPRVSTWLGALPCGLGAGCARRRTGDHVGRRPRGARRRVGAGPGRGPRWWRPGAAIVSCPTASASSPAPPPSPWR